MTQKYSQAQRDEARDRLREILKPGDTVFATVKHVSRSGMYRVIDLHAIQDNEPIWLSGYAGKMLGYDERHQGVKAHGCGMDMRFEVVYSLSRYLFPDGFECTGNGCPSNDHMNGDRNYEPHHHKSGGYALKMRGM